MRRSKARRFQICVSGSVSASRLYSSSFDLTFSSSVDLSPSEVTACLPWSMVETGRRRHHADDLLQDVLGDQLRLLRPSAVWSRMLAVFFEIAALGVQDVGDLLEFLGDRLADVVDDAVAVVAGRNTCGRSGRGPPASADCRAHQFEAELVVGAGQGLVEDLVVARQPETPIWRMVSTTVVAMSVVSFRLGRDCSSVASSRPPRPAQAEGRYLRPRLSTWKICTDQPRSSIGASARSASA